MIQVYSILSLGKVPSMLFEFIPQGFLLLLDGEGPEKKDKQKEAKKGIFLLEQCEQKKGVFLGKICPIPVFKTHYILVLISWL